MELTLLEKQINDNTKAIDNNKKSIERIHKAVFGNGEPGMDEVLRTLNDNVTKYIENEKARKIREADKKDRLQLALIGIAITQTLGILGLIVSFFLRMYPTLLLITDHLNVGG